MAVSKTLAYQQLVAQRSVPFSGNSESRKPLGLQHSSALTPAKNVASLAMPLTFFAPEATRRPKMDVNTLITHLFENASTAVRRILLPKPVQNPPKAKEWQA
jgi:hypothetical protein